MMKISVFLLLVFTDMVLCYTRESTCESFRWLDSKGKGSCDFKTDFCGWTNNYNWKVDWCDTHYRNCCVVEMNNNEIEQQLMSPQLCGSEDVHYTMNLRYEIPKPNKYTLSVYLMTHQSGIPLWQTGNKEDVLTEELNFTLPQLPFQIMIEGKQKANKWNQNQTILILDVSFHQKNIRSNKQARVFERKSSLSPPVVTKTTIKDNRNNYRTNDLPMTTTTTSMTMDFTSLSTSITQGSLTDNTISTTTLSQSISMSDNTSTQNERQPGDAIGSVTQETPTTSETQSTNSTSDPTTVAAAVAGAVIAVLISVIIVTVFIRRKTKKTRNSQCDRPPTVNPCLLPVNTARGHVIPSVAARSDPDHYDCVQDAPRGKPRGAAGATGSSTLAADDIYNHTHDSVNKQLGRHGEGGGGIYSTLATEDTYSHLQGKEHHRFDGQGDGNKNPQLVTAPEDHYNHL